MLKGWNVMLLMNFGLILPGLSECMIQNLFSNVMVPHSQMVHTHLLVVCQQVTHLHVPLRSHIQK